MRIVIVAETFLPQMNGVVGSVLQLLERLGAAGHEVTVVAPGGDGPSVLHGAAVLRLRSLAIPGYPDVRVTAPTVARMTAILEETAPDVVHLASPFLLGWAAVRAAERLGIPTVAVYQTDIPGYAARYGLPGVAPVLRSRVARIHRAATLTLSPSSASTAELEALGVERIRGWARGVDAARFTPQRRDEALRRALAPHGETIVGYVGRLAAEKQVEDLAVLDGIPGVRLVIVGDGPTRAALERAMPGAEFLGFLGGDDLARAVASFDVFVHPGEHETFCQTVQEALASGVPVVATGRGGPVDLVASSRTGWLYRPGDLADLRDRVLDLVGDPAKRAAFAAAARASVAHRTWDALCVQLVGHYREARRAHAAAPSGAASRGEATRAASPSAPPPAVRPIRFVAVGDSITEGLSDASRQAPGEYRGWADRLAAYLQSAAPHTEVRYANLGVRGRRVAHVVDEQIPAALALGANLVTVLIGANDLIATAVRPTRLAAALAPGIRALVESGADVVVIAPVAPRRWYLPTVERRFRAYADALAAVAGRAGVRFVDLGDDPLRRARRNWSQDRVHLSSQGHRLLAYRVAAALGLPEAAEIGALDAALHEEPGGHDAWTGDWTWFVRHALPWVGRRVRGRTAGDGLGPKRPRLEPVHAPAVGQPAGVGDARKAGAQRQEGGVR